MNYSTTFPNTGNLVSVEPFENTVSATWNNPVVSAGGTPGRVTGIGSAGTNDAVARKTGVWGPDQTVNGTVSITGAIPNAGVELQTRLTMTPGVPDQITGYEFEFINGGNLGGPVRWNGNQGDFTLIGGGYFLGGVVTGDVITVLTSGPASNVRLEAKLNGTSLGVDFDTAGFGTGNPGIALDDQGDGGTWGWQGWSADDGVSSSVPPVGGFIAPILLW